MIEKEEAVKNDREKAEEAVNAVLLYYCTMCASKHYDVCASKGL